MSAWRRPWAFAAASVGLIALFFILREHWSHALGLLPYAILLACPLLHLFHGHGGHRPSDSAQKPRERRP